MSPQLNRSYRTLIVAIYTVDRLYCDFLWLARLIVCLGAHVTLKSLQIGAVWFSTWRMCMVCGLLAVRRLLFLDFGEIT